jgi:DUF4097 and DUF4098 domain-containing protein YvlB
MTTFTLSRFVALLTVATLAWAGPAFTAQAQELTETSDGFRATLTETFDVQPNGTLTIDRVVGSIDVSVWDQNRVEVTESIRLDDVSRQEAQEYVQEYQSTMEQSGNSVSVRGPERNGRSRWRGDVQHAFQVRVPPSYNTDVSTAGGAINVEGTEGRVMARTSGGSINVEAITGEVRVNTSGGSLNLTRITGPVEGNTSGGSINVEDVTGRLNVRTSGGSLNIIGVQSDVSAQTSGGSVYIEDVQGSVRARTSGGSMDVGRVTQDVSIQTSGGDIEVADIGGRTDARTSGGDIEGRTLRGSVDVTTSAGDIELADVQAGVDARTSIGDIEVELTLSDFSEDYTTELTTSHGDIEIVLPPDLPASIEATVEPLYQWDRDDILSDFPLSRTTPNDERSRTLRSSGDINGGGPRIELRTNGGSIRIERGVQ